jgi:aspartyl-tRNA synthetase
MQLDAEMSFATRTTCTPRSPRPCSPPPRPHGQDPGDIVKITWHEAMDRFGIDKPDLRFGMELTELTDVFAATEFKAFAGAACIKGINACRARPPSTAATSSTADRQGQEDGCQGPGVDEGRRPAARSSRRSPSSSPRPSRRRVSAALARSRATCC